MILQQLFEATLNINSAVDYIYKEAFKSFIDEIQNYKKGRAVNKKKLRLPTVEFSPKLLISKLHSPNIKKVIQDNPVTIKAGVFTKGSYYDTINKVIYISFNMEAYNRLGQNVGLRKYNEIFNGIPPHLHRNFEQELSGAKIKSTIAHEISHWVRDTQHDKHITRMVDRAKENPSKRKRILNRGTGDDYLTDYEMDALIHGMEQIKRAYPQEEWDTFTLADVFELDPSAMSLLLGFKGRQRDQFMKLIIKRMSREGLLGKNMSFGNRY